jgi:hypothetical protein
MYSRIYKKENKFQVRFLNKHTKEEIWKTFETLKEAIKLSNEIDVNYHLEFKNELPKGITFDKTMKRFRFQIWISSTKIKHIISSNNLQKVIEARKYMLLNTFGH